MIINIDQDQTMFEESNFDTINQKRNSLIQDIMQEED